MRVSPKTFIKDPSPSAHTAWQMSFSGDTSRAGKYTPVTQLWLKTGLGHLRAHTKHAWGSQAFLSEVSWMSKALIECILRNALGSPIWHSSIQTPQGAASCATSTLSTAPAKLYTAGTAGTLLQGQSCTAPGLAPSCSAAHCATQQCLTSEAWLIIQHPCLYLNLQFLAPA